MKKTTKISVFFMLSLFAILNILTVTRSYNNSISLREMFTIIKATAEQGGSDPRHSQVVGCGSKAFEAYVAGCCAGTGGCTDNCDKTPEYCD